MNGRIYDADTGRFMQADPFVQAPSNLQNYNRFSYVMNNPMSATDPSGYISIFKGVRKFVKKHWRTIAAIAIIAVTGYGVDLFTAFGAYEAAATIAVIGGAAAGYVGTGTVKGAVMGAISGAAFYGIGQTFNASSGFFQQGGAGHLATHAVTGGIFADLQGGNFGHGFWSAGITKGAQIGRIIPTGLTSGAISSAILGGTVSKLTGGKFANGAITAAFQFAMNEFINNAFSELTKEQKISLIKLKKKLELEYSTKDGLILKAGEKINLTIKDGEISATYATKNGYKPFIGDKFAKEVLALGLKAKIGQIALEVGRTGIEFKAYVEVPGFLFFNSKTVEIYSVDVVNALMNTPLRRINDYANGFPEVTCQRLEKAGAGC